MKKNIAPIVQEITDAQISRIVSRFSERCHKKCALLPRVIVQDILEHEGHVLSKEMFDVLYRHIERRSEMVIRHVKVDRTKTGEQLITALNCKEFVDIEVLATMPTQGKKEENLYFFPVKQIIQVGDYVKEFESRGLVPDPYAQMKANIDDPKFADKHPNGFQWGSYKGRFCYVTFYGWDSDRRVSVDQNDGHWENVWWFAGVRK